MTQTEHLSSGLLIDSGGFCSLDERRAVIPQLAAIHMDSR
jgi:hypothetical protein